MDVAAIIAQLLVAELPDLIKIIAAATDQAAKRVQALAVADAAVKAVDAGVDTVEADKFEGQP